MSMSVTGVEEDEEKDADDEEELFELGKCAEISSTSRQSSSTSWMLSRTGEVACHCRLNQLAKSL